jgi:hypothetical protein
MIVLRDVEAIESLREELPAMTPVARELSSRVGGAMVRLQKNHHRQERGRQRVRAGTGIAIHRLELGLESLVEQLVPMDS